MVRVATFVTSTPIPQPMATAFELVGEQHSPWHSAFEMFSSAPTAAQQPAEIPTVMSFSVQPKVVFHHTQAANQAAQDELSWLQHLLQVLPTGVVVLDQRGFVQQANPVAVDMLGEPLTGQRWLDVITRSFRPRSDDGMEVSLHDGRRVKLAITSLHPQPGQLIVLTDLTETRQLQSRIAHLQRLSALGKMMASLAHQIRTPLSSAMLYAQNLQNQKLAAPARVQFQEKLLNRLLDLEQQVNDLLLFARSGREQQVSPLSVQELLGDVQSSVESMVLQHEGQLEVSGQHADWYVLGNSSALTGALSNLIQNAIQHAGPGARIHLSASPDPTEQNLHLRVSDHGPGVPEHLLSQIFEPFFTTRSNGTGLGLAVVQAVANSHHGTVRCHNNQHGGACFELILPMLPAAEREVLLHANSMQTNSMQTHKTSQNSILKSSFTEESQDAAH